MWGQSDNIVGALWANAPRCRRIALFVDSSLDQAGFDRSLVTMQLLLLRLMLVLVLQRRETYNYVTRSA